MMAPAKIIMMMLTDPKQFWRRLKTRAYYHYHLYIAKTPFYVTQYKWRKDNARLNLRINYPLNSHSIVFDIGGYHGDFAEAIYERYGSNIYIFEPIKKYFDLCNERFANNPKIKCFNFGLSDVDGEFSISNNAEASSIVVKNPHIPSEKVKVKSFERVIRELGITKIDLVKMNIEGSEYHLMPHIINSGLIHIIDNLQIQFHHFIPDANHMRDGIRRDLAVTHQEEWNYPFVFESWRFRQDNVSHATQESQ